MTIAGFIDYFFRQSHIGIGDGLFYVHSNGNSEIVNCNNVVLMTLSENEYCLRHKNKVFTIYNEASDTIYFFNMSKEKVASLELDKDYDSLKYKVRILKTSNLLAFPDYKNNCICFINYKGNKIKNLFLPSVEYLRDIHQLSEDLIVIDYFLYGNNDPDLPSDKFYKSEVYNLSDDSCILKKEDSDYSDSIITNVSLFLLPCKINNLKASEWDRNKTAIHKVPVIKYSVIEPIYSYNEQIKFQTVTKFCDFIGNHIKDTPYSDISPYGDFYLTSCHFPSLSQELYGILDQNFEELLPCLFRELSIDGNKIWIPQSDCSDILSEVLDLKTKRFELIFKSGDKILLPFGFSYASLNKFKDCPRLLKGYTKSESGDNLCGIIDIDGEVVLPALYTSIQSIHDNLYVAYLPKTDNNTEPTQQVLYISDNKIIFCKRYLYVEEDPSYEVLNHFRTRLYEPNNKTNVKFGLIDSHGTEILPPAYDYISFPKEGKACYVNNGKAGWYDVTNESSHEFNKYSFIKSFTNSYAIICTSGVYIRTISKRWGEIGGWDEINDSPLYGDISYDDIRGEVKVYFQQDHQEGIINNLGQVIVEPIYHKVMHLKDANNFFIVKSKDKYGCINLNGEIVVPIVHEWFSDDLYDLDDKDGELDEVIFLLGTSSEVLGYNSNLEVILKMSRKLFEHKFVSDDYDYNEDNYDYDRDTYYALGGSDYDVWRNNGGNIDDMMDRLGF